MNRLMACFVSLSFLFSQCAYASFGKAVDKKEEQSNKTVSYYEANVKGLRKYLETLRYSEPQVYSQLDKTVDDYENRDNIATAVSVTSKLAAVTLLVGSFSFLAEEDKNFPGTKKTNFTAFFGSGVVWILGGVAASYIEPDREDYYDFINEHNRLKPNDPLEFSQYLPAPNYETHNRVKQHVAELSLDFKF